MRGNNLWQSHELRLGGSLRGTPFSGYLETQLKVAP